MPHKKPKLIPYKHTLYDILIDNIKGKYLQNVLDPKLIAQIPEENQLNIHYVENGKLSVWFPLFNEWGNISLDDFVNYAIISEEQFKEYQKDKASVFDYLLVPKDSEIFKKNKANLSENKDSNKSVGSLVNLQKYSKLENEFG
jgi:hypothetical protein